MSHQNLETSDVTELKHCVACGSSNLKLTLDLGSQPLANSYKLNKEDIQTEYPLAINRCEECYHVQLTHSVNPELMFNDYLYVSGTSKTMHSHMKEFADFASRTTDGKKFVLDVGCNDGTQLDYFADLGYLTFGVDPAKNLHSVSTAKGHTVFCDWFDNKFAKQIVWSGVKFDLVTAQNVFAHGPNPLEFLLAAKDVLNDEGTIIIQTSQANMIKNNEFDTIYHEHISFFNINSMNELCKRAGLFLVAVDYMPIHGTSFIFVIKKKFDGRTVDLLIKEEAAQGMYLPETYIRYAENCNKLVKELKASVDFFRQAIMGWNVVGYGAAAKGMTLLNYSKIHLDYIVDDNSLKQGRFTPGSSIPILSADELDKSKDATLFVPLAWNFFDEIREKIVNRRKNPFDRFITYFPKVEIRE